MATVLSEQDILNSLHGFYKDWLIWAGDGAPRVQPFDRHSGLCSALCSWAYQRKVDYELMVKMKSYMKYDFRTEGLDTLYPFGEADWNVRSYNDTMHECPKRLAFVYKMINRSQHGTS